MTSHVRSVGGRPDVFLCRVTSERALRSLRARNHGGPVTGRGRGHCHCDHSRMFSSNAARS